MSSHEDLDKALLVWFTNARERSVPIDGKMLISKIEILAKIYNIDPIPSRGWLQSWGKRHCISFGKQHGEAASADTPAAYEFLVYKFLQFCLITHFQTAIIVMKWAFTTNVYQNSHLNSVRNKDAVRGIKQDKTRFRALVCCNADGSDKVRLTIIDKYVNPRPLKGCMRTLPVNYRYNTKAWMTGALFTEFLDEFNSRMRREKRRCVY
ncbi:Tigger transposable element-derived protein 6-like [Oopsacas minuta]|uniref:Tigger transposable element-derived protein 6-like n=1 Tax=Oopsacas minuta TaxID=111878 RepID=A0AAV7JR35_9METZ|nr:Tigger transposable element-derived protein 6-like [Oopsacas minuta]